jgi:hypothetical protein
VAGSGHCAEQEAIRPNAGPNVELRPKEPNEPCAPLPQV